MSKLRHNVELVLERLARGAARSGRPVSAISLVAATKTQSDETILQYQQVCSELGIKAACGENYAQELQRKVATFPSIEWHFIGHLQRNKAAVAVASARLIQSVDSVKLLESINSAAGRIDKRCRVLLQVNVSRDPSKEGLLPESVSKLAAEVGGFAGVELVGLMTVLQYGLPQESARACYRQLAELGSRLDSTGLLTAGLGAESGASASELSMGMSDDFDLAIEEGATLVRVGTAIFGPRAL